MKRIKVVYLIRSLSNSGGMERVISLKANYLADRYGYDVEIITYSENKECYFKLSNKVRLLNFYIDSTSRSRRKSFLNISRYINESGFDFFISTGGKDIELVKVINKSICKILEVHFSFKSPVLREVSLNRGVLFKVLGYLKIIRNVQISRFFDFVVPLTNNDANLWSRYSLSEIIPIVNPSPFELGFDTINTLKSNVTNFVAVGRLNEQKDFDSLITICMLLKMKFNKRDWFLYIYGEGELEEAIQNRIIELGLTDNVKLKKAVSNISDIYLKSDFLLMTSVYEGLPMVLIEAMSHGVPCVSFDCESGPSDIIKHGYNGYIINGRDLNMFASVMSYCIDMSDSEYKNMSINAYSSSGRYSERRVLSCWDALFKSALYKN